MNVLEKEIEDIICNCLDEDCSLLSQRGLYLFPNYIRQVNLGSYGIADIVTFSSDLLDYSTNQKQISIQVVELKKDIINATTFFQAIRYAKGIKRMLQQNHNIENHSINFRIKLIGKSIDMNGEFIFLSDIFPVDFYTYKVDLIKGVKFRRHQNYTIRDEMRGALTKKNISYIKEKLFS